VLDGAFFQLLAYKNPAIMPAMIPTNINKTAPASPFFVLGLALRPILAKPVIQPWLNLIAGVMQRKHPRIVTCLSQFSPVSILVDPTDVPFSVMLSVRGDKLSLRYMKKNQIIVSNASISGPLSALIDLMEGRVDGDALFFSRELAIEGCSETVVALRNALEHENVSVQADFLSYLGPLAKPAGALTRYSATLARHINNDFNAVHESLVGNVQKRCDQQERRHTQLADKVSQLEKQLKKATAVISTLRRKAAPKKDEVMDGKA
jgi:O2-independent ubiquinone biosynthesis accessory factor UbiT